jgi:hypothetical protein
MLHGQESGQQRAGGIDYMETKEERGPGQLPQSSGLDSDSGVVVQVFYDMSNNVDISNEDMLQLLPSEHFSVPNDQYTFAQLLFEATGHWNISRGAIKSQSVVLVNKEGKEWPVAGRVLYLLRSKLVDAMRGVVLRYKQNHGGSPKQLDVTDGRSQREASFSYLTQTARKAPNEALHEDYMAELWRIFAFYCLAGDPKELCMRSRSFTKLGADCGLYRKHGFSRNIMEVIFDQNKPISSAHMSFDQFLDALAHLATRYFYPSVAAPERALGHFLLNELLPNANMVPFGPTDPDWVARQGHVENIEVQEIFQQIRPPLKKIYAYYARQDEPHHQGSFKTLPMSLNGFRRFSREVGMWDIGIGAYDLATIFIMCSSGADNMGHEVSSLRTTKHVLFYDSFLTAIGHAALIAFPRIYKIPDLSSQGAEYDDIGPRVLKSFFQHTAWCFSKMRADIRPEGANTLVRSCLVLFETRGVGSADHLHMYERQQRIGSDRSTPLTDTHQDDSNQGMGLYAPKTSQRRVEQKREFFHAANSEEKEHSISGRRRIHNIFNRINNEENTAYSKKSEGRILLVNSSSSNQNLPRQTHSLLPSNKVDDRVAPQLTLSAVGETRGVQASADKAHALNKIKVLKQSMETTAASPALLTRFGGMAYTKALRLEHKLRTGNMLDEDNEEVEGLFNEGDQCFLNAIKVLEHNLSDEEAPCLAAKLDKTRYVEPLSFHTRVNIPEVSRATSRAVLKQWGTVLISIAKRRLSNVRIGYSAPRMTDMLPTPPFFCTYDATIKALTRSLMDVSFGRELFLKSLAPSTNNKAGVKASDVDLYDNACAMSFEADVLYALKELEPQTSVLVGVSDIQRRLFDLMWGSCVSFCKSSSKRLQAKGPTAAFMNNWALALFRLGSIEHDFPKALGKEIFEGLPRDAYNLSGKQPPEKISILNGALYLLKSLTESKQGSNAAIAMVEEEVERLQPTEKTGASVVPKADLISSRRRDSLRRKRSIVEWNNRPGTPVTPMLRRDSRSMSATDIDPQEAEELPWTSRFADYFTVIGRGKLKSLDNLPKRPEDMQFSPVLLDQFPKSPGLSDMPVPAQLPDFCFPNGVGLLESAPPPTYFHFVLTDVSGTALYVSCITFYDKMDSIEVLNLFRSDNSKGSAPKFPDWVNLQAMDENPVLYTPKCLCIISHWGFFNVYKRFLATLFRIYKAESPIPLERYIINFMFDVPLPPRGDTRVQYTLADETFFISRPEPNELPLLDLSMKSLFEFLSLENVVTVIGLLLCERSVVLCSRNVSLLTPAGEALRALLFPFSWQAIYIPVLPRSTFDFLYSPVPFFMGICADLHDEQDLISGCEDVVFIDLDRDDLYCTNDSTLPRLPDGLKKKLLTRLKKCSNVQKKNDAEMALVDCLFYDESKTIEENKFCLMKGESLDSEHFAVLGGHKISNSRLNKSHISRRRTMSLDESLGFTDVPIRDAFLRFFVSLFANYKKFLSTGSDTISSPFSNLNFDKVSFLNENKTNREFLGQVVDTQLFAKFVTDRSDPTSESSEVVFFDESIIDKAHKKSFSLRSSTLQSTPLLNDRSHAIKDTYVVPAPNTLGLESDERVKYHSFPSKLSTENYGPARTETFLVDVSEKAHRVSATLRSIYHHRHIVPAVSEASITPAQSFRQVISFINIIVDHIVLLSVAEVRRKKLEEQTKLLQQLQHQMSMPSNRMMSRTAVPPSPAATNNGDGGVDFSSPLGIDSLQSTNKMENSVGFVQEYARTVGGNDSRFQNGTIGTSRAGKKVAVVFRIKNVRTTILPLLEAYEFNFLSRVCRDLKKVIREEKQLWHQSIRLKSLPTALRGRFWLHCGGVETLVHNTDNQFYYDVLDRAHNAKDMKWADEINFDVQHIEALLVSSYSIGAEDEDLNGSGQKADFKSRLRNVLYAYATFDPDLGYCNGMSQLVGFILWWLRNVHTSTSEVEQRAFWMLVVIFRHFGLECLYAPGLPSSMSNSASQINPQILYTKFNGLLESQLPALKKHFENESVDFADIYTRWFRTMFTEFDLIPPSTVARLWDIFFIQGWDSLLNCVIALLSLLEEDLLQLPLEGILLYLRTIQQQRPEIYHIDPNFLLNMKLASSLK